MSGRYATDGAALTFGTMATTRMACEETLMAQEAAVLEALAGVTGWEIDADGLLHLTGGTELVLQPSPDVRLAHVRERHAPAGTVAAGGRARRR